MDVDFFFSYRRVETGSGSRDNVTTRQTKGQTVLSQRHVRREAKKKKATRIKAKSGRGAVGRGIVMAVVVARCQLDEAGSVQYSAGEVRRRLAQAMRGRMSRGSRRQSTHV